MPYEPDRHGPRRVVGPGFRERVFAVVQRVPPGFVTTYGDVAEILGRRSVARQVGFALAALGSDRRDVPWHRVVGGQGRVTQADGREQLLRLRAEGVRVDRDGRLRDFREVRLPRDFLRAIGGGGPPVE